MFRNRFRDNFRTVIYTPLILAVFSLLVLGACKSSVLKPDTPPPEVESKPALPPIATDGTRNSYADIVERASPAVVKVMVQQKTKPPTADRQSSPFGDDFFKDMPGAPQQQQRPQIERGLGSGVIITADGTILTNHHVVDGADKIQIELTDKRTFAAKVVGSDQLSDLAVLKIEASNLPFLNFGDSDKVRVGDVVLAIGNPLGIGQTVTAGIISAKGRRTGLTDGSFEDFLQTDAPINRGNSGGALINLNGELIGINSQILSPSGGNIGIGFSIPANMAKPIMDQLRKDGKVHRGQLGVVIQPITEDLAKTLDLKDTSGIIVSEVKKDGAAEKAGVRRGEIITAIDGGKVEDGNSLRNKIAGIAPGSNVKLTIIRDGKELEITAKLEELSSETSKSEKPAENSDQTKPSESGRLGLDLQPLTPEIAKQLGAPGDAKGLVVTDVDPTGPGAEAGIDRGDMIIEVNRQAVSSFEEVQTALKKAGDKPILLLVYRKGQTVYVTVEPKS